MATRIAMLGAGQMGTGIGLRLLDKGFDATACNRTREHAEALVKAGAGFEQQPADAVTGADVVVVSLADEHAVNAVLSDATCAAMKPGTIVIDLTTTSAEYARRAAAELELHGLGRVEACAVGNPVQARTGQLRLLVSGTDVHIKRVREVLDAISSEVRLLGPAGTASTMKLVFNALLGAQVAALAEAVSFGERAGLDTDLLLSTIANSGLSSKVMSFRAEIMRGRRYQPAAFRTVLMNKDLNLVLQAAKASGICVPVIERAADRFRELVGAGFADHDAAALLELQRR